MGNAFDQQRFMMAWMDIYKHNLGLMQPPAGSANPPEASQAQTSASTLTKDSRRTESPTSRSSRKRSYSVASNESEKSSCSAAEDTESSTPTVRRTPSDPKHIFETEGGSPLSFFVQVDVTNRGAVVSKIKKHGGTMALAQETADFSVLQTQSKVFKTFLKNSAAVNKPAVSASFIHDCVDNGVLYHHSHFLLQPLRRKRQKKAGKQSASGSQSPVRRKSPTRAQSASSRPQSSGSSQAPKKKQAALKTQPSNRVASRSKAILKTSDHSESPSLPPPSPSIPPQSPSIPPQLPATRPQTNVRPAQSTHSSGLFKSRKTSISHTKNQETSTVVPHKNGKEKEKPGQTHAQVDTSTSEKSSSRQLPQEPDERSPSPPPAHTRVVMESGNYRYPPVEKDFALRYMKVLFGRDHEMTMSAVAQKTHEKMPHHTVGSWMTTLTAPSMRAEVDAIRKRAGILYRKNLYAGTQPKNQMQDSHAGGSSTEKDTSDSGRHNKRRKTDDSVVETVSEAQIQSDVDTIANFLLSRQSQVSEDEQDEDTFWNLLTAKARCKGAKTWKEFYQKHSAQILAKCEAIQTESGT
ncbi:hypothetical protein AAF712_000817 [Marasmius tenuissimus]|uniref:BRCT domain-containing protein n=1 Tax=Marasmius tenuissimus TaxID=585030 RepID=A0ABR3AEN3_9AGAR